MELGGQVCEEVSYLMTSAMGCVQLGEDAYIGIVFLCVMGVFS